MKPTKIAFDPSPIHQDAPMANILNEIRRSNTVFLTAELRVADLVRSLQLTNQYALLTKTAGGNDIKARIYIRMIDRFEALIMQGYGFSAALYQMMAEDWLIKLSNFESVE